MKETCRAKEKRKLKRQWETERCLSPWFCSSRSLVSWFLLSWDLILQLCLWCCEITQRHSNERWNWRDPAGGAELFLANWGFIEPWCLGISGDGLWRLRSQTRLGSASYICLLCPGLAFPECSSSSVPSRSLWVYPQPAWARILWVSVPFGFTSLPSLAWGLLANVSATFSSTTHHLLSLCTCQAISQQWSGSTICFLCWSSARENFTARLTGPRMNLWFPTSAGPNAVKKSFYSFLSQYFSDTPCQ